MDLHLVRQRGMFVEDERSLERVFIPDPVKRVNVRAGDASFHDIGLDYLDL